MRRFIALCLLASALVAQGKKILPIDACTQAQQFRPRGIPGLQWHPDGKRFTFLRKAGADFEMAAQDLAGKVTVILKWSALSKQLEAAGVRGTSPNSLIGLTWRKDGKSLDYQAGGARWRVVLEPMALEKMAPEIEGAEVSVASADGRHLAYVKAHDVWLLKGMKEHVRVSTNGGPDIAHGVAVSRVEFGITDGLWWDPTSRRIAFYEEDFRPIAAYPYVDHKQTPAKLVHGRYPMAGQPGSIVRVGVHDVKAGKTVWLATDPKKDEYLTNVTWVPGGDALIIAHVSRSQDRVEVVRYDAVTGEREALLFVESDHEWVEPEHGPLFLPDGSGDFLWVSSRSGHRHFWHYRGDGRLVGQVTKGKFDMRAFVRWAPDGKGIFWETSGPNPLHKHLFFTALDASAQRAVTSGRGHHAARLSPDGAHALDVHSNLELPQATDLIRVSDGKVLRRVHRAKDPFAEFVKCRESFFTVKGKDGAELHGYLILPPESKPGEKLPVINYVYGGPHSQLVTDQWISGFSRWTIWLHAMAQRGYVCFIVDGRGTANRGIDWVQAVHRRLGTVEADDQVAGLEYVLKRKDTDPDRVGVTGWSYGGFMTATLLTRKPEWYKAGVSGAPVTDWAYYETGYGERYMDTPQENPKGYATADPGSHAKNIKGRLLVVHGSRDETVMWQSSIEFVRKCIDAGAPVDYMVYPGQLHGLRGKNFAHFINKMTDYFDLHVKGTPRPGQ